MTTNLGVSTTPAQPVVTHPSTPAYVVVGVASGVGYYSKRRRAVGLKENLKALSDGWLAEQQHGIVDEGDIEALAEWSEDTAFKMLPLMLSSSTKDQALTLLAAWSSAMFSGFCHGLAYANLFDIPEWVHMLAKHEVATGEGKETPTQE